MLQNYLENNKNIFKLVCGAGNECVEDVEKLTYIYSLAGAEIFDICAKPEILLAAKRGIETAGVLNNRYICVSVGMKGDPHISKSRINSDICTSCGKCGRVCPNDAISDCTIDAKRCIGCCLCQKCCPIGAISTYEQDKDLNSILPELIHMGIDCIELHATSEFDEDVWEKWEIINKLYSGVVSICIDRLNLGNKQVISRLQKMISLRKPYSTIIQADGIPMSGSDDSYKTTLQAVAMAEIIQNAKLPVYILISGGTNSKSAMLANMCDIQYSGVAVGSYARKIVRPFIKQSIFDAKDNYTEAIKKAKDLVEKIKLCV